MLKHKDLIDFKKNPFELFNNWYDQASETEINDPNAMTLSTILNNQPSSRVVLLKSHDEEGFVFYTNSNSKKGKSINENNNIGIKFDAYSSNNLNVVKFFSQLEQQILDYYLIVIYM